MSPIREITGERPSAFSRWHRKAFPSWCLMTDGDFFLQVLKDEKVYCVAYIEEIQIDNVDSVLFGAYRIWPSKDALCREIMRTMNVPSFIVYHNLECTDFLVFSFSDQIYKRMVEQQYINFEKSLRINFINKLSGDSNCQNLKPLKPFGGEADA